MPRRRLGVVAALALGAAQPALAQADRLRSPPPPDALRACRNPLWPAGGGFVVPGTATCLRVYGQARFDYRLRQQFFRITAPTGFRGVATVGFDAVTPTELGAMRTVAQLAMVYRAGEQRNATAIRQGFALDGDFGGVGGPPGALRGGGAELLYGGFVQVAGFTAGRTVSFFDPFFVPDIIGTAWRAAPVNVSLLAYTARLGEGVSATLSFEDPTIRRQPILNATPGRASFNYVADPANVLAQGGLALPHLVGSLQLDRAWGTAKAAGVLAGIRPAGLIGAAAPGTRYGFAVIGALKLNLPAVAPGDTLALLASYGEGAVQYSFATFQLGSTALQNIGGAGWSFGDGAFDAATGRLRLTRHLMVAAGYQHVWSPQWNTSVFGSWRRYDAPFALDDLRDTQRDGVVWSLGANTIWTPVRGFSIAMEGAYVVTDPKGRVPDLNRNADSGQTVRLACDAALLGCFTKDRQANVLAHLRIIRDF